MIRLTRIVIAGTCVMALSTGVAFGPVTDHVTYLSVRPDPDRALPAGDVYPLLLKNLPPSGK